jgi:hypothetical protein
MSLLALVVVIIVISAGFGYYYLTASSSISSLNSQVSSLNSQVSSLQGGSSRNVQLSGTVDAHGYLVTGILFASDTGQQITATPSQGSYSVSLPNDHYYSITVTYSVMATYTATYTVSYSCTSGPSCYSYTTTTTGTNNCSPPRLFVNVTSSAMTDDISC